MCSKPRCIVYYYQSVVENIISRKLMDILEVEDLIHAFMTVCMLIGVGHQLKTYKEKSPNSVTGSICHLQL